MSYSFGITDAEKLEAMISKDWKKLHIALIYEKEEGRYSELINRGKIYVSIITIYLAVFSLNINELVIVSKDNHYSYIFSGLTGISFILSLLFSVLALAIYKYEGLCDIKYELISIGDSCKSNEEFYEDRLADIAVSYNKNSKNNDKRATLLAISSYLIVCGISLHLLTFFIYLLEK